MFPALTAPDLSYRRFSIAVTGSPEFSSWFGSLPQGEMRKKLQGMMDTLKERPFAGDYVRRELWPQTYIAMDLQNLYRFEVDKTMRATYSIKRDGLNVEVRIVEFFATHKEYEKRF